ncbi:hypothetical protein [Herbaspirillum huttiense]|uniref:hypothetical protein n=1 Tax=Herbaspirillum huttiense TaxID=863372 RepID=UPI0031E11E1E
MKISNQDMLLIGSGILVFLVWRARQVRAAIDPEKNPDSWYEDQWSRLHGRDLSVDGNHGAPSPFDPYGITNAMGWNYKWDGSIDGTRINPLSLADSNALKAAYV